MFVILQKYDFSSKSQPYWKRPTDEEDVCDTAKVRFFKQITTTMDGYVRVEWMFVILQKYDFSSKSQHHSRRLYISLWCLWYCKSTIFQANHNHIKYIWQFKQDVCDTAKVRFFKQITTLNSVGGLAARMFVILQKYDFSSKSQRCREERQWARGCLWYCKSTIFQANHNIQALQQIGNLMFVILQKYDFSSKSQHFFMQQTNSPRCLWYCKSTIFQANHNYEISGVYGWCDVCDTAKVRFFKQITTSITEYFWTRRCLWYCKSTIFQANHNWVKERLNKRPDVCDTAKVRFFKQITTHRI